LRGDGPAEPENSPGVSFDKSVESAPLPPASAVDPSLAPAAGYSGSYGGFDGGLNKVKYDLDAT
jgi:hypothetical protein